MENRPAILWISAVEPDAGERSLMERLAYCSIERARDFEEALASIEDGSFDVIFASFPHCGMAPAEWLDRARQANSEVPIVVRQREGSVAEAVRMTKLGVFHYFGTVFDEEEAVGQIEAALEYTRSRVRRSNQAAASLEPWRRSFVGESPAVQRVAQIIRLIGKRRCTVLITGETGTGKEVIARAIHEASPRSGGPMVAVNCSALPEHLLEAELFGHVRGAFTGAQQHRVGRFEQAHTGTLFLDEIADMPLSLQAKLLRVLQERELQRLGSSETIKIDVRVIAATNANLAAAVRAGTFREDLYYRLNVVPIELPPLRARLSDVPVLAHHFVEKICRSEAIPVKSFSREALVKLGFYDWPGNVRQLENAVEMAVVLSGDRSTLLPGDFPLPSRENKSENLGARPPYAIPDCGMDYEQAIFTFEKSILSQALQRSRGNKKLAADMLGLKRTTLAAKVKVMEEQAGCPLI